MSEVAWLLLHGFGGTPFEMQPVADALTAAGYETYSPCLPGHGTTLDDFSHTFFADWQAAAVEAYDALAQTHKRVCVAGLSMGGTLALHLGCVRKPAGIATFAAPLFLYRLMPFLMTDWRLPLVGVLKHVKKRWPMPERTAESMEIAPWRGYSGVMMLPQLHSLLRGMRSVERELDKLNAPLLMVHAKKDRTVPYYNALHAKQRVSSQYANVLLLDREEPRAGHHIITTHRDYRKAVVSSVLDFAQECIYIMRHEDNSTLVPDGS